MLSCLTWSLAKNPQNIAVFFGLGLGFRKSSNEGCLAAHGGRLCIKIREHTMAEGLNRVMLLGNLGADPELRMTPSGQSVLNLRLATTERYMDKNKSWQERTDWHNIVIWGKRGEALHRILGKGSTIFVEGSLRTSSYEDQTGAKRYKTEINAINVILTGGRGGGGQASRGAPYGGDDAHDGGGGHQRQQHQAPARGGAGGGEQQRGGHGPPDDMPPDDYGGGYGNDDDIPF
jgi:single-strand DNA-binding protein